MALRLIEDNVLRESMGWIHNVIILWCPSLLLIQRLICVGKGSRPLILISLLLHIGLKHLLLVWVLIFDHFSSSSPLINLEFVMTAAFSRKRSHWWICTVIDSHWIFGGLGRHYCIRWYKRRFVSCIGLSYWLMIFVHFIIFVVKMGSIYGSSWGIWVQNEVLIVNHILLSDPMQRIVFLVNPRFVIFLRNLL